MCPLPCGQLLFEWGVSAMRCGDLKRAEELFTELEAVLPAHVPGRGHRAKLALARGRLDVAAALIKPPLETSDDPRYRAIHAEILAARGDREAAAREAEFAAVRYELLLARRPEAYAEPAAIFSWVSGIGPSCRRSRLGQLETPRHAALAQASVRALRNAEQVRAFRCRPSNLGAQDCVTCRAGSAGPDSSTIVPPYPPFADHT